MRISLTLALLIIVTCTSMAQKVSFESGMTISKIDQYNSFSSNTSLFTNPYLGFYAKAGYQGKISTHFNLHSQIGFAKLGGNGTVLRFVSIDPEVLDTIAVKHEINDISFDGGIQFEYGFFDLLFPYLGVGVGMDYLQSTSGKPGDIFEYFKENNEFNSILFKLIATAGLEFKFNSISIALNYQFNLPMNRLVDYTSEYGVTNEISIKYSQLGISIGYFFD